MSPNASNRSDGRAGFTLVEVTVAIVVSAILSVALIRFYKDSYRTFSLQEQVADRNQNAQFLVNKFVEVLQQAGTALPDSGWTVVSVKKDSLTVGSNPRGAQEYIATLLSATFDIPIADTALYANTGNVLLNTTDVLIYFLATKKVSRYALDLTYNSSGYKSGIKKSGVGSAGWVRVKTAVTLNPGDKVYGYREDQYLIAGGTANLVVRPGGLASAQMVLAENIDSVGFTFLTRAGAKTAKWDSVKSASIVVRARTEKRDPKLPAPGYHKITVPMNILFRNKV